MTTVDTIPCPHCDGTGRSRGLAMVHFADGCRIRRTACMTCKGWGTVPSDYAERERAAEALRLDRIGRNMSLREEAKRIGITPRDLSDREHVRDDRPHRPGEWRGNEWYPLDTEEATHA